MRVVDLTHHLVGGMPQYPGQPAVRFETVHTVARDGNLMTEVHAWSHVGTHADAPAHMIQGGATTYEMGLERWMGPAQLAQVSVGLSQGIEPGAVARHIRSDSGLLVATGHSTRWGSGDYYAKAPHFTVKAAEYIRDAGVKFLGIDFPSPDPVGSEEEKCHQILLGAGIPIIENLTRLIEIGEESVWFFGAPLLMGAGDGGFCRAVAVID